MFASTCGFLTLKDEWNADPTSKYFYSSSAAVVAADGSTYLTAYVLSFDSYPWTTNSTVTRLDSNGSFVWEWQVSSSTLGKLRARVAWKIALPTIVWRSRGLLTVKTSSSTPKTFSLARISLGLPLSSEIHSARSR